MASNYTQPINIGNPVEHTIEGMQLQCHAYSLDTYINICIRAHRPIAITCIITIDEYKF